LMTDKEAMPSINVQSPPHPSTSSASRQMFFQVRSDLASHRPGEPYGYIHVYNGTATQCFPFGFPSDKFAAGPIVPQVGGSPVFFTPTGQLVVPAGSQVSLRCTDPCQKLMARHLMPS
jgi:hypothetical protein